MSTVSTRNTFQPGAKIAVHPRTVDFFDSEPLDKPVATATAGDYGEADFSGLDDGARFWLVSDEQVVNATAKGPDVRTAKKSTAKKSAGKVKSAAKKVQAKARAKNPSRRVVTGSRGTKSANPRSK